VIGAPRAREMLLTGRALTGREAAAWGLVTRSVKAKEVEPSARALADEVANNAPLSVRGSKAAIRTALHHRGLDRATDTELFAAHDEDALRALTSTDVQEGLSAMRERRRPDFTGA
jgi:enoyl-CoA hydratase/carnithine racemase